MPKITFYKQGQLLGQRQAELQETILDVGLSLGLDIEHACEKSCACTTCHVYVNEGFSSLPESSEIEDDFLDKAWGLKPQSRLSCQAKVQEQDLEVELPLYTINIEKGH